MHVCGPRLRMNTSVFSPTPKLPIFLSNILSSLKPNMVANFSFTCKQKRMYYGLDNRICDDEYSGRFGGLSAIHAGNAVPEVLLKS